MNAVHNPSNYPNHRDIIRGIIKTAIKTVSHEPRTLLVSEHASEAYKGEIVRSELFITCDESAADGAVAYAAALE